LDERSAAERASRRPLSGSEGFRAFYAESLPTVYGYFVNRCGGSRDVAEDLTQETFMAAVRELQRGTPVDAPIAWILGIAKHKLIDHFRREERAERKLQLVHDDRSVGEIPDLTTESRERVLSAMSAVPAAQRAALTLRYVDGLSVPEVAAALRRSIHASESLLARGRESFRRAFEVIGDD
jgi:RNA polymerase sigma-70 factor (ECF subfamily)